MFLSAMRVAEWICNDQWSTMFLEDSGFIFCRYIYLSALSRFSITMIFIVFNGVSFVSDGGRGCTSVC